MIKKRGEKKSKKEKERGEKKKRRGGKKGFALQGDCTYIYIRIMKRGN